MQRRPFTQMHSAALLAAACLLLTAIESSGLPATSRPAASSPTSKPGAALLLRASSSPASRPASKPATKPASKPASLPASRAASLPASQPGSEPKPGTLAYARKGFVTQLLPGKSPLDQGGVKPEPPPPQQYALIHYKSPAGNLVAYLSPDPRDGKKHPAVIWALGGYGGIGDVWTTQPSENDQTPAAFRRAGFVVMVPAWRGRNDNPGRFEMWFGEIDDALAAVDHLAKVPYVDPTHIYLVGHSTGGIVALLAAECSTKLRAAFSLDGCPDIERLVQTSPEHPAPYVSGRPEEGRLRSAVRWVESIQTPTWFFGNSETWHGRAAMDMARRAKVANAPFHAFILDGANHFDIVRPMTEMLAQKIAQDTGATCSIQITPEEVERAYGKFFTSRTITCVVPATPGVRLTPAAREAVKQMIAANQVPATALLTIAMRDGRMDAVFDPKGGDPYTYKANADGVLVQVDDRVAAKASVFEIDLQVTNGKGVLTVKAVDENKP